MMDQRARPAARGAWRWRLAILGLALMTAGAASGIRALEVRAARPIELTHPHALWRVVHDLCVPDRRLLSLSAPCMKVSLAQGWAVVKDVRNPTHLLLVPTRRIIGIESPFLTTPDAPNYWAFAWNARPLFERLLGRPAPREDIGLVVNSRFGRTQDQLHIHIDCIRPQVAQTLARAGSRIGSRWTPLGEPLLGRSMLARRLDGADFGDRNPFAILAREVPGVAAHMDLQTLVAVGATGPDGRPGFILLTGAAHPATGDAGVGEEILDHGCGILSAAHSR